MSRPFVGIGAPMIVRFGRADLGRRVTLRRALADAPPGGPSLGDVVGVLETWQNGVLSLRRRKGDLVEVAESTIVAGRVVAPEIAAVELDGYADDTWPADEQVRLGDWRLRYHHGVTNRPNSALASGDPGVPIADALAALARWYAARDATPAVMTPVPSAVADACAGLGWEQERETLVLAGALTDVVDAAVAVGSELGDLGVVVTTALPDDWSTVLPGLADPATSAPLQALMTATSAAFATLRDADGAPVAVARAALTRGWVNITSVEVLEQVRGRRLAAALVAALAAWSLEQRATHAYLQMWPDNTPALRLYERLGFVEHHRYAYYVPSQSVTPSPPSS